MVKDGGALAAQPRLAQRAATGVSADAAGGIPRFGIARRGGNNHRPSSPWREVISLAGVARSFSQSILVLKLSVPPPRRDAGLSSQKARYAKQRRKRRRSEW
jgi:hypothetical protein